jgi:hypothetical protein
MLYQRINFPPGCGRGHLPGRPLLFSACAFLLLAVMLAVVGCTPPAQVPQLPQKPSPPVDMPVFTFEPIEVQPASPVAGQAFNVSMKVANTGPVAGTYKAELIVNGNNVDNRALYLDPGKTDSLTFQTTLPVPGQYLVKIGPQSKEIIVGFNRVPATIRIDSGNVDGCDPLAGSTGQPGSMVQTVEGNMLKLSAPANGMEINSIDVFGYIKSSDHDYNNDSVIGGAGTWVYGGDIAAIESPNPNFSIVIYDARKTKLFSADFSKDLFTYYPQWVSVPLPGVPVSGDFYVELVTHNQPKLTGTGWGDYDYWHRYVVHTWYYQLCIGYENSLDVQSSVSQNGNVVSDRYLTYNWLMRAGGYQLQK